MVASGSLSGPGLDQQLVQNEQTAVQGQLDALQQSLNHALGGIFKLPDRVPPGKSSRNKVIRVSGLSSEGLRKRLRFANDFEDAW